MSHTPGPWSAFYKHKYDEWHVSIPLPDSTMTRALFDDGIRSENPEADARLIAAAPDLLEAAQKAELWLTEPVGSAARVLAALRNAIAKATGDSNAA